MDLSAGADPSPWSGHHCLRAGRALNQHLVLTAVIGHRAGARVELALLLTCVNLMLLPSGSKLKVWSREVQKLADFCISLREAGSPGLPERENDPSELTLGASDSTSDWLRRGFIIS